MKRQVVIRYSEDSSLSVDVIIYDPKGDYDIRFIHPLTLIETELISDLLDAIDSNDAETIKNWHNFVNALRLVPDRLLLQLDALIIDRDGHIVK